MTMGCCKRSKLSRQQWFTLGVIGSVHFASAICISLQAPFYPHEAESKNATATEYGFVFGIFELVSFISSPILGKYIDLIGAKLLLNSGIFLAAFCNICFGLLDLLKTHADFISLSFLVRIVEALGSSAAIISSFAITATVFPDNMATTFATLEIFYGLGYIIGPTIGGLLFTLGGYMLPFMVMGSVLMLVGIFILLFLPNFDNGNKKQVSLMRIFKVPSLVLAAFSISATSIAMGFYSATLEPHIRVFDLSPVSTGLIFVISGATYAATAPFVGRMCDWWGRPKVYILFGSVLTMMSVFCVGPAPFIPLDPSLWLVIIGLIFQGLGMACIFVPGFIDAIRSAVKNGFPDDITTYGLMSGMWASAFSLGAFIGPSVAGALYDLVGFRWGSMFIVVVHSVLFISLSIYICKRRQEDRALNYDKLPLNKVDRRTKDPCVNIVANWASSDREDGHPIQSYGSIIQNGSRPSVQDTVR